MPALASNRRTACRLVPCRVHSFLWGTCRSAACRRAERCSQVLSSAPPVWDAPPGPPGEPMDEPKSKPKSVRIPPLGLEGLLGVPHGAVGLVIFAHGSGSGRHSVRNNEVAAGLRQAGLATLLLDLLRPEEEAARAHVFDIELLASRLAA